MTRASASCAAHPVGEGFPALVGPWCRTCLVEHKAGEHRSMRPGTCVACAKTPDIPLDYAQRAAGERNEQ